jgi:F-box and leucine-rich repeat protein GRR1
METGNEGDDEEYDRSRTHIHHPHSYSNSNAAGLQHRHPHGVMNASHHPEVTMQRDRTIRAPSQSTVSPDPRLLNGRVNGQTTAPSGTSRRTTTRAFGQQPVVETSTSPTPSDVPSNRSTGSNGAFFRTYQEAAPSSRSNGALTPDLIFAEIGHGRGANNTAGQHMNLLAQSHTRRGLESTPPFNAPAGPSSHGHGVTQATHSSGSQVDVRSSLGHDRTQVLTDSSNSYRRSSDGPVTWPHVQSETVSPSPSSSPTTRELHESVQSALGVSSQDVRDTAEGRGRRVKRSFRNTISAAENYATSFLFGRGGNNGAPEGQAG